MPKQAIERGVVGGDTYEVGQRICVTGTGTANLVHAHGAVKRFTATMMVVELRHYRPGRGEFTTERRYRLGGSFCREVGAHEYGGSTVGAKCRRPRKGG